MFVKKRLARFEPLEERQLLAVWAGWIGGESSAVEEFPAPTSSPSGYRVGDLHISSTLDWDQDGFIGPGELSQMSYCWMATDGSENWNPVCDFDRDGFIGPGDYALLSNYWFKNCEELPFETRSYEIYPSDLSNWALKGKDLSQIDASDGILTLDARNGDLEAVCDYDSFPSNIRISSDFKSAVRLTGIRIGIELGLQDSGECYFAEFQSDRITLFYVDHEGKETSLASTSISLNYRKTYRIWAQMVDGQVACGIGDETLLAVQDNRLTTGRVGFFAARGLDVFSNIVVDRSPQQVAVTPTQKYITVTSGLALLSYAAFPDVCRLQDGRLMAVVYVGYGHVSHPSSTCPNGGRICATYSYDDGRTWTELQTIADTGYDDRDPSVVQLEDGRILCNFFSLAPDGSSSSLLVTKVVETRDGGITWTDPAVIYEGYAVSSPIRVLSTGRLLMPLYRQADGTAWGAVGISDDQGTTWETPVTIPRNGYRLDAETDLIERNDGSIYAVQRYEMAYSISLDGGNKWSPSRSLGFHGQCPYLYRASTGEVIMALREELNPTVTTIRISLDDCHSWGNPIVVDQVAGAYASIVERLDGSFLILYYEDGTSSNIRARCFSLKSDGTIVWNLL